MLARDVLRGARSLLDWQGAALGLGAALEEAYTTFGDWQTEGYTEIGGICVSVDWQNESIMIASLFLGTVFSLSPSGKYYLPFACSNVDLCPRCHGTGHTTNGKECTWCCGLGSREAWLDQLWQEEIDRIAGRFGLFVFSGEGDPCDLFVGMSQDVPEREN